MHEHAPDSRFSLALLFLPAHVLCNGAGSFLQHRIVVLVLIWFVANGAARTIIANASSKSPIPSSRADPKDFCIVVSYD
jgi:hypothetical protein